MRTRRQNVAQHTESACGLTPARIARDFSARSLLVRQGLAAYLDALHAGSKSDLAGEFARWQAEWGVIYGGDVFGRPAWQQLGAWYQLETQAMPAEILFALHTLYAALIDRVAGAVLCVLRGRGQNEPNSGIAHDAAPSAAVAAWLAAVDARLSRQVASGGAVPVGCDWLRPLYEGLFPRRVRHALGEYYTPDWLADWLMARSGFRGQRPARVLDPACGSGSFLLAAIRRVRAEHAGRGDLVEYLVQNVVGFDLNPLAVRAARANYALALADLAPDVDPASLPVFCCDTILGPAPAARPAGEAFDFVVGNPPWIAWDHLPEAYRRATAPLWQRYGLFSLSASAARHGGAKKDLSTLMTCVAADRHLRPGGRLAMILTQTVFQTHGAGDGFRRFRLGPEGAPLRVVEVHDLVAVRPFPEASNRTSVLVLEKGAPTQYPVPYVRWFPGAGRPAADRQAWRQETLQAQPADSQRPGSPWRLTPRDTAGAPLATGRADYRAYLGANSGGANGVYWLHVLHPAADGVRVRNAADRGLHAVETIEATLEPTLLYPLLRWGDVGRFAARPSGWILLAQDPHTRQGREEAWMRTHCPRTLAYLERFRPRLQQRAAYRRYQSSAAFYSMYNVGPYTLAPLKVVWRRMERRMQAAVAASIEEPGLGLRPLIPQETCVFIACDALDEAHYLCALLNSGPAGRLVESTSVCGGKGFGSPSILEVLPLRRFDPGNSFHQELAACSRAAHAARGNVAESLQQRIDDAAGAILRHVS